MGEEREPESFEGEIQRWRDRALEAVPELDGMSAEEQERYFRDRENDEAHQRQLERCREIADRLIPPVFRTPPKMHSDVRRWLDGFWSPELRDDIGNHLARTGLILVGRAGCGKTQNAHWVAAELLERGVDSVRIEETTDLFDELTRLSHTKSSDKDLILKLSTVELLILDDLGAKPLTPFREDRLERILNGRWKFQKPTLITSNIAGENFTEFFGERNASRISGMCSVVVFPRHDHRSGIDYSGGNR